MADSIFIYCIACADQYVSGGETPEECPSCHTHKDLIAPTELWTMTPPYRLNRNDFRLLRSLRIDAEETPDQEQDEEG